MNTTNTTPNTKNVLETAAAEGSYKSFAKAVEGAGMGETLRGSGPFTVFAPTDAAFEKLPSGKLEALLKPENKAELASLVGYHVLKGRKLMSEVRQWDSARTLNGQAAPVKLSNGQVSIDGAVVTNSDIDSANGVIHGIDKVNFPSAPTKQ